MRIKPREVEKILLDDGWVHKATKGSHKHFVHPVKAGKVTVPQHPGDSIDRTLLERILKQAGISPERSLK